MTATNTQRLAQIAVTVQFLALVRSLLEFFRLKSLAGATFNLSLVEPYVMGAFIAAIFTWLGVTAYLFNRYAISALIGVVTVLVLIAYKIIYVA